MREQIAIQLRDNMGYLESLAWDDLHDFDREMFYEDADRILSLIRGEIEKVENRYIPEIAEYKGFENCRQAILKALEV